MLNIVVVFTCFNRKEKTRNCILSLERGNRQSHFEFVVVDDGSTDGTQALLHEMSKEHAIHLVCGTGELFYSGGMRLGMKYVLDELGKDYDYLLMVNDDVDFYPDSIEELIRQSKSQNGSVIVGTMCSKEGTLTYSAIKYKKGIKYEKMGINDWKENADTFNANCVLIPYPLFLATGPIDGYYRHSLGDFDYGLALTRNGARIHTSQKYCGVCNPNDTKGTWRDTSLTRRDRIKRKESVKGAPTKQWFYFLKKNFSLMVAVKGCITPYIRILLGK